jgi:hypothetical protein
MWLRKRGNFFTVRTVVFSEPEKRWWKRSVEVKAEFVRRNEWQENLLAALWEGEVVMRNFLTWTGRRINLQSSFRDVSGWMGGWRIQVELDFA